jgi:hypothetical protein
MSIICSFFGHKVRYEGKRLFSPGKCERCDRSFEAIKYPPTPPKRKYPMAARDSMDLSMKYRHKEDCFIDRQFAEDRDQALLVDCDGHIVFRVSASEWSDDQIWRALELQNEAYAKGVQFGQVQKVHEIKKALCID